MSNYERASYNHGFLLLPPVHNMWRSLLLGKLAISVAVSLLIGGYCMWSLRNPDLGRSEYFSWLGVGIFFLLLAVAQIAMVAMMFRKKKLK